MPRVRGTKARELTLWLDEVEWLAVAAANRRRVPVEGRDERHPFDIAIAELYSVANDALGQVGRLCVYCGLADDVETVELGFVPIPICAECLAVRD